MQRLDNTALKQNKGGRASKRSSVSPNISAKGVGSMAVDTSSKDEGGVYLLCASGHSLPLVQPANAFAHSVWVCHT